MIEQRKGKGFGCLFGCLFVFFVSILALSLLMNLILATGFAFKSNKPFSRGEASDEFPALKATWSYGSGDIKVVRIPIHGVITRELDTGFFSPSMDMVESAIQQIKAATADEEIQAIILEVDSPGGGITPTDEIYHALRTFRESSEDRRIVTFCRGLAASGGYYVAMASDWIVAEPTSVIGSIGVIIQTLNWKVLSEKIGLTDVTITSGKNKDMLNPFRDIAPEERQILQDMVDGLFNHFVGVVSSGRTMTTNQVMPFADGRVFLPQVALEAGLIDEVGYWKEVMDACSLLLDVEEVKVMRYERPGSFWQALSSARFNFSPQALINKNRSPQISYLWNP